MRFSSRMAADADAGDVEFVIAGGGEGQPAVTQDQQAGTAGRGITKE